MAATALCERAKVHGALTQACEAVPVTQRTHRERGDM